jgi:hypothetical protein
VRLIGHPEIRLRRRFDGFRAADWLTLQFVHGVDTIGQRWILIE